ncbi:MAG: plasma-membrane proton-efflux P-type ATPase [Candidatus Heimdallarchaeota archaeon]|nr:plasma-membrane proton-efflux P-type ATPase [Candidatus Heimdallarchaeota archaeon]
MNIIKTEIAKELNFSQIYSKLESSENGLTSLEAEHRIESFGYNEIIEQKTNLFKRFLINFWGPIPWMIEIAAILSIIIQHWEDFFIISVMLLINAGVRFWEENKAENAVELLKSKLAIKARALRDENWQIINARELVPGDIVRIRLGDIIPADLKLLEGDYLNLDESALTGESLPKNRKSSDVVYEGSIVRKGEMTAIVTGTGINTFFGKTTSLVSEARTESHFQKAVITIGNYLIVLAITLVSLVFIVGLSRGENFSELLQFALVLIIAAIPVALPAVLMVSMAVGASDLAKKKAITKRLLSIEELAGMDILCVDKTGTITKNELTVGEIIPFENYTSKEVIQFGVLASREDDKDPIDDIFFKKFKAMDGDVKEFVVQKFFPFDPVVKRTESVVEKYGQTMKVSKGAIQAILSLVTDRSSITPIVVDYENQFASEGFRVLGVAKTEGDNTWHFIGIVAIFDPPRGDSAATIKKAVAMGVEVKMITGDHIAIAKETATKLGLGENFVSASMLWEDGESNGTNLTENIDGYAEVYPEHKYKLVEAFQKEGHIVGMTGDGVNDAPALKNANVGIAVSNATDAAKSAADIVLTKPGLSVIIDAIEESRTIFERMKSYTTYRIAETVRVLIFLVLVILIFNFYPITAIMIVILALLNDLPIMTIAFDNVKPSQYPNRWNLHRVLFITSILGSTGVCFSFILFLIGKYFLHLSILKLQTLIFLKLAVSGHMTIYLTRTEENNFWQKPYPAKILFVTSETTQIIATIFAALGVFMTPIGGSLALFVWVYAIFAFLITNFIKVSILKYVKN